MPARYVTRFLVVPVLAMLFAFPSWAQQTPPSASPAPSAPLPQTQTDPKAKSEEEKQIEKQEQSQRVLGVLPQFAVTSRQDASPLTSGEKFHLFAKATMDPVTLGIIGLQAGLSQANNEFPAYGQGAAGYGKRYGASLADSASSGFFSNYFYPSLLKQDPRYFRLGEGHSVAHRLFFGARQEFWCHDDKGKHVVNWSSILGSFTSGAISNLYYPGRTLISTTPATATTPAIPNYEDDRGIGLTLSRSTIALAYGMAGGVFDEFWPDIHRKLFGRKKHEAGASVEEP
ncbi:MAG TPA: hypothetical protein VMH04_00070 [Candidatus Solibacter sp.]|nr:hypothetical protein [Candidatus Solibacter sp.]